MAPSHFQTDNGDKKQGSNLQVQEQEQQQAKSSFQTEDAGQQEAPAQDYFLNAGEPMETADGNEEVFSDQTGTLPLAQETLVPSVCSPKFSRSSSETLCPYQTAPSSPGRGNSSDLSSQPGKSSAEEEISPKNRHQHGNFILSAGGKPVHRVSGAHLSGQPGTSQQIVELFPGTDNNASPPLPYSSLSPPSNRNTALNSAVILADARRRMGAQAPRPELQQARPVRPRTFWQDVHNSFEAQARPLSYAWRDSHIHLREPPLLVPPAGGIHEFREYLRRRRETRDNAEIDVMRIDRVVNGNGSVVAESRLPNGQQVGSGSRTMDVSSFRLPRSSAGFSSSGFRKDETQSLWGQRILQPIEPDPFGPPSNTGLASADVRSLWGHPHTNGERP